MKCRNIDVLSAIFSYENKLYVFICRILRKLKAIFLFNENNSEKQIDIPTFHVDIKCM